MTHDRNIIISITEGRAVRDLLYNGLHDILLGQGYKITLVTDAAQVPQFVEKWSSPGIDMFPLVHRTGRYGRNLLLAFRRSLLRKRIQPFASVFRSVDQRWMNPAPQEYVQLLDDKKPVLVLSTHVHAPTESPLICLARSRGIPTLGMVRSWDNLHKGVFTFTDWLSVWSEVNRREACEFEDYDPERVVVTGPPQFDAYFAPDALWSHKKLADHLGLDPSRPILVLATLGKFFPGYDETYLMDDLLATIGRGDIPGRPQLICRLHPLSRLEMFVKYQDLPDVRLSYVDRFVPGLDWTMTRDDVIVIANMLRHADVVITPGSTMTIEAAIFDTPVLVPIYHTYQPDFARSMYRTYYMARHFGRIIQNDLVPVINSPNELTEAINRCLAEPAWYHEERKRLVEDYVHFTDGRSTERLANLMLKLAAG